MGDEGVEDEVVVCRGPELPCLARHRGTVGSGFVRGVVQLAGGSCCELVVLVSVSSEKRREGAC